MGKKLNIYCKICIAIYIFIMLFSFTSAANPFVQTGNAQTLYIAYSPFGELKQNTPFDFEIHVSNNTAMKTNQTTSCFAHLYQSDGAHMGSGFLSYNTIFFDWNISFSAGNTTQLGPEAFYIQCNSSDEIGFASGTVSITGTGIERTVPAAIGNFTVVLILTLLFLLTLYGTLAIEWKKRQPNDEHVLTMYYFKYLKIPMGIACYIILTLLIYLCWGISLSYLELPLASEIFKVIAYILLAGMPLVFPLIIVIAIVDYLNSLRMNKNIQRGLLPR